MYVFGFIFQIPFAKLFAEKNIKLNKTEMTSV